ATCERGPAVKLNLCPVERNFDESLFEECLVARSRGVLDFRDPVLRAAGGPGAIHRVVRKKGTGPDADNETCRQARAACNPASEVQKIQHRDMPGLNSF